jgi:3-oxoacyl-[acyl-carrier protein] reductase
LPWQARSRAARLGVRRTDEQENPMPRAIVTGAASGLGMATARLLHDDGWTVLALDRVETDIGTGGKPLRTVPIDVTRRADIAAALDTRLGDDDTIDLVANVAGVFPPSTLATFTEEQYRLVFDVNVLGILNVTAESAPRMREGSSIVNIASVNAFAASRGLLLYDASKAAVVMLTKGLALELARRGIRVNALAPSFMDTQGTRRMGWAPDPTAIPLGRFATTDEVARWVRILSSPDAGYLTGETIVLSGGEVLR